MATAMPRDLFLQISSVFTKGWATWFYARCQRRKARLGARKTASRASGKMTKGLFGGPRGFCCKKRGHFKYIEVSELQF